MEKQATEKKIIIKVPVTREQLDMIHERMKKAHTDMPSGSIRRSTWIKTP